MARPLRIEYPGAFYHITTRGNHRQKIFLKDKDYVSFFKVIDKVFERYPFFIHCFVLMGNHYHLLLETPEGKLSKIMQFINSQYTHLFNFTNGKSGHVFQGRYKSLLIDKDAYLLELSRYIHLNPLKAGVVKDLTAYRWSSFSYYAGLQPAPKWLRIDLILSNWDMNNLQKAFNSYKRFIAAKIDNSRDVFKNVYGQTILGDKDFVSKILEKDYNKTKNTSYSKKFVKRVQLPCVIEVVSTQYNTDKEIILKGGNRNNAARQVSLYLIRKFTCLTNSEIACNFENISFSAGSKSYQRVQEKRKINKKFDKQLSEIEDVIMSNVNA